MATGANTTGKTRGTGRSSKGDKATNDEMLTEVKKEEDGNSDGEMIPKDEDDDPKGQDNKSQKMKSGTGKKSGQKSYDDTPLPNEDDSVDEDEHDEDQGPVDRARSSNDDEEAWKKSEAEQKAQYQRRLNFLMEEDEKTQKAKKIEQSRRGRKNDVKVGDAVDGEPTEGEAVGVTEVRGKEQSSGKPSPKTQRKPKGKGPEDEMNLKWSPIVQKMVDDEI